MKKYSTGIRAAFLTLCLTLGMGQAVYAEPTAVIPAGEQAAEAGSSTAVTEKPTILAEGACLMDAATGQVLFGKNENKQFYPASITKVMTALLTLEKCSLTDVVTFSKTATTNLEAGASGLDVSEGDQLTVEQALYGFLLKSANEIGNGLAEHISGSNAAFAELMNQRAAGLGCKNTHFANPHGLNDPEHLTTPYDMCLILREALNNPTFRTIDSTTSYEFPAIKKSEARKITMGHKMMQKSDSRYYEGIIGGKTGYTSKAGNTLVTGAERNGVRLIAVVMKSQSTHYRDTKALLDYGFQNYEALTGHPAGSISLTDSAVTGTAAGELTLIQPINSSEMTAETKAEVAGAAGQMTGSAAGPGETAAETTEAETMPAETVPSETVPSETTAAETAAAQETAAAGHFGQNDTGNTTATKSAGIDQYTGAQVELKAPGL